MPSRLTAILLVLSGIALTSASCPTCGDLLVAAIHLETASASFTRHPWLFAASAAGTAAGFVIALWGFDRLFARTKP